MIDTKLNGRYRIESEIGSGGMSTVYLAFDETLERPVAVKVLAREISTDPASLERFRREARTVAQLSHRHVVMVIDAGEDGGHPFIVFEYVPGETLKDRIRRIGPLPISEAVAYAIEIGRALEAAHEQQLVHRDVKPQNVLLDEEGSAKVTDFGIARSLELDAAELTGAGKVVGTTDYVSPEQALGHEVTGQSDVYSLGIVLFEMLTGEVPFKGESAVSVAMKHVRETIPDVQSRRPHVSAALAAVVERATAKDVAHRYATAAEMVRELEEVLKFEAARSGPAEGEATAVLRQLSDESGRSPWRRRAALAALYACIAAAVAVGAGLLIEQTGDDEERAPEPSRLSAIRLGERDAADYDPAPGDGRENATATSFVLDDRPGSAWETERYDSAELGNIKDGVGLYLDAGRPLVARAMRIATLKPGWRLELYVANDVPGSVADWTRVGSGEMEQRRESFPLDTGGRRFRYYLVWITELVEMTGGRFGAAISDLRLLG